MQSLKTFQQQSTWTCDRHWTCLHLASQSNQLATDLQRRWRQCDNVGNYDEQADAKSAVMHSPLMASAYNFINLQTCDDAFSCFWKDETRSERWSQFVNMCYCRYFEDSRCTDTQSTNQNCERRLWQIWQWNYLFVLKWICLDMWVRVEQRWTFCVFGSVGTKVHGNLPVVTNAFFFNWRAFCLPKWF